MQLKCIHQRFNEISTTPATAARSGPSWCKIWPWDLSFNKGGLVERLLVCAAPHDNVRLGSGHTHMRCFSWGRTCVTQASVSFNNFSWSAVTRSGMPRRNLRCVRTPSKQPASSTSFQLVLGPSRKRSTRGETTFYGADHWGVQIGVQIEHSYTQSNLYGCCPRQHLPSWFELCSGHSRTRPVDWTASFDERCEEGGFHDSAFANRGPCAGVCVAS